MDHKNIPKDNIANSFIFNPSNANPIKWSNTLKQFVGNLPTNCLSVFDHFVGLTLKGLSSGRNDIVLEKINNGTFHKIDDKTRNLPCQSSFKAKILFKNNNLFSLSWIYRE